MVYLSDDALKALKAWYKDRDVDKEYVFYAQGRHTMTYTAARMMFMKYLERPAFLTRAAAFTVYGILLQQSS